MTFSGGILIPLHIRWVGLGEIRKKNSLNFRFLVYKMDLQEADPESLQFVCRRHVGQCTGEHHTCVRGEGDRIGRRRGTGMLLQQRPRPNLLMLWSWRGVNDVPD